MPKPAKNPANTPPAAKPSGAALTDTKTLRERARKSVDDGAITFTYTADRKQVIRLLNEALATEWVCVLRYYRHYYSAKGMLVDAVKDYVSLGEIADVYRRVFGLYREPIIF